MKPESEKKDASEDDGEFSGSEPDFGDISSENNDEEESNEYPHDFEYTESIQGANMFTAFRKNAVASCISVVLTLAVFIFSVWIECFHAKGLPFEKFMQPGHYGKVYAMVSLQTLALCVLFNIGGLFRGVRKMSLSKPAPESVAAVVTALCALHTLGTAAFAYKSSDYKTFCYAGCFVLLVLSVNTCIKTYTMFKTFAYVVSKSPKRATVVLDALAKENGVFAKYLGEDSEVLSVTEAESVSDFVKMEYTVPKSQKKVNVLMYISLVLSFAAALAQALIMKMNVYTAVNNGMTIFLLSAPIGYLTATALPYLAVSSKAHSLRCSVVGESAPDYLENAGVISFDDTEVFPPKAVKITSIKTYNSHRLDRVILYMARIFDKLGGPLSYVFSSTIQSMPDDAPEVMLLENTPDGLHLTVGGDDVLVGNSAYLRMFDIEAPKDDSDETEMRSLTSILYLVCNGSTAAKFYIRYSINRRFETVLKGLYDAGVCCGIKTCDPGIDNQLLAGSLKGTNYPISVIHKPFSEVGKVAENAKTAIVGLCGIHNYLRCFIITDKLRSIYKTNTAFALLATIIGIAAALAAVFAGGGVSAPILVIYHLVWMIPTVVSSLVIK